MSEREKLAGLLGDPGLIKYFYLDKSVQQVLEFLDTLQLTVTESQDEVPFNAQVKGYQAAQDQNGDPWIIKSVLTDEEMLYQRSCMIAYLLDHETGTLAAPTTALLINGKKYRATKVVKKSVQISSYNYLEAPFINLLRADLVNRWIYFDEDRNPNNYLVITNSKNKPFLVAIDYDKADILASAMKITGMPDKFGWLRAEKTRFLTLLRPEHFEGLSIAAFDHRLTAFRSVTKDNLLFLARGAFRSYSKDAEQIAEQVTRNILGRCDYVDRYFRSMFMSVAETKSVNTDTDYSAFGPSFMAMHNKKK